MHTCFWPFWGLSVQGTIIVFRSWLGWNCAQSEKDPLSLAAL